MGINKMTSVENVNERGLNNDIILDNTKLDCQKPIANFGWNIIDENLTLKNHVPRFTIL